MKNLLLASVAVSSLMLGGAAFADTTVDVGAVLSTQTNTSHVVTELDTNKVGKDINNINGTVTQTAAAIGNSLSVTGDTANGVTDVQHQNGYVAATLNTVEYSVNGAVTNTAAAIGNTATVTVGTSVGDLNNTQTTDGNDPIAHATADIHDVLGNVSVTSAAIGNTYTVGGKVVNGVTTPVDVQGYITSVQKANSPDTATSNLTLDNLQGDVTSTTAAIGNTATVTANYTYSANINQVNTGTTSATSTVTKNLTTPTDAIKGSLSVTSAAIGNTATLTGNYTGSLANEGNAVINQTNSGKVTAELTATANTVNGTLTETAAAIGNTATSTGTQRTLNEIQTNSGDVSASATLSTVSIGQDGVGNPVKNVSTTIAAIGDSLNLTGSSALTTTTQQTNSGDIKATGIVDVNQISGTMTGTAAAIGNSLTAVMDQTTLSYTQSNTGDIFATGDFKISNVGYNYDGHTPQDVSLTVAAIGNSLDLASSSTTTDTISQTNNNVWTKAVANVGVNQVTGNLSVTAAAIGNSASVHVK